MSVPPPQVDPDTIRTALRVVFSAREYRWIKTSNTWTWLLERWYQFFEWLDGLRLSSPAGYYLLIACLVLVLAALLTQLAWTVRRSFHPRAAQAIPGAPVGPIHDAAWHLAEARRLGAARRFADALGHRFLAAMLELDARRVIHFDPSKTPAEYAAEARLDEAGRSELRALVASLYRHLFGRAPLDEDTWRRLDAQAGALGSHAAAR